MTDHTDTIRRLLLTATFEHSATRADVDDALAAFEAERREAIGAQVQATAAALEAGRTLNREKAELREKAIDALREAREFAVWTLERYGYQYAKETVEKISAALVKLGEQP